jgi:hypothetical protein
VLLVGALGEWRGPFDEVSVNSFLEDMRIWEAVVAAGGGDDEGGYR